MAQTSILERFDRLNVWSRNGQRAPNKPLLLLYALGRWSQGDQEDIPYQDVDEKLTGLLSEFGPVRQVLHPEYPFWHLPKDVWTVQVPPELRIGRSGEPLKSDLLALDIRASFSDDVKLAFRADPSLMSEVASRLLEQHFPDSLHADILDEVGLSLDTKSDRSRKRDPRFRHRILVAYDFRCAVCNFDLKIGTTPIALDAAHIRWHQADGPDAQDNGLALCVLHHKAFDLGAFTVTPDLVLLVSELVNGVVSFEEALYRHHGQRIREAQRPEWLPDARHLNWHREEVFKGSPRHT